MVLHAGAASSVTCRHHWLIPMPQGPYSEGRCKLCGAVHTFRNSEWEESYYKRSRKAHIKYCTASKEAV